jgi:hypothetical protein
VGPGHGARTDDVEQAGEGRPLLLDGYKLKDLVLVRTQFSGNRGDSRSWRDRIATTAGDVDIRRSRGRQNGSFQILARDNPDVWRSNRPAEGARRVPCSEDHRAAARCRARQARRRRLRRRQKSASATSTKSVKPNRAGKSTKAK